MVILVIIGVVLAISLPRLAHSRARATLTSCVSNVRNIGTALQTYANDNAGKFPTDLSQLTSGRPAPLPYVPNCPSDNSSYQTLYQVNNGDGHYTLACNGVHHLQLREMIRQGYPQYYSTGQFDEGRP